MWHSGFISCRHLSLSWLAWNPKRLRDPPQCRLPIFANAQYQPSIPLVVFLSTQNSPRSRCTSPNTRQPRLSFACRPLSASQNAPCIMQCCNNAMERAVRLVISSHVMSSSQQVSIACGSTRAAIAWLAWLLVDGGINVGNTSVK